MSNHPEFVLTLSCPDTIVLGDGASGTGGSASHGGSHGTKGGMIAFVDLLESKLDTGVSDLEGLDGFTGRRG